MFPGDMVTPSVASLTLWETPGYDNLDGISNGFQVFSIGMIIEVREVSCFKTDGVSDKEALVLISDGPRLGWIACIDGEALVRKL